MNIELKTLKESMQAQVTRSEVLANNLANINSTGYKRDAVFLEVLNQKKGSRTNIQSRIDFSQGNIRETNNPLDLAISGKGFFVVDQDGEEIYTRNGRFNVDEEGFLITTGGQKVLGSRGWINLTTEKEYTGQITINQVGEIYSGKQLIDRLRIVDFPDYQELKKIAGNAFRTPPANTPVEVQKPTVLQGRLEESNVQAADEMITMIEVERQFESYQKVIKILDHAWDKTVNNIGRFR